MNVRALLIAAATVGAALALGLGQACRRSPQRVSALNATARPIPWP